MAMLARFVRRREQVEAQEPIEPEAPILKPDEDAAENAAWRRAQHERELLFGGNNIGPFGDRRKMLWIAGRQIDWRRFR